MPLNRRLGIQVSGTRGFIVDKLSTMRCQPSSTLHIYENILLRQGILTHHHPLWIVIEEYHRTIGMTLSALLGEVCYAWNTEKPDGGDAPKTIIAVTSLFP